jgi:hypothetical protein
MYNKNIFVKEGETAINLYGAKLVAVAHSGICVCIGNSKKHSGGICLFPEPDITGSGMDTGIDRLVKLMDMINGIQKNLQDNYFEAVIINPPASGNNSGKKTTESDCILNFLWMRDVPIVSVMKSGAAYRCVTFDTYTGIAVMTDISDS